MLAPLLVPGAASNEPVLSASTLGVEIGARYELVGPDGTRCVFNDSTDAAFVGYLTDVSGIDSAEVRDNVTYRAAGDGAVHGDFYYGRRPIVFSGLIAATDAEQRNQAVTRLQRATSGLRDDVYVKWQTTGGVSVEVAARRNDPLRISDNQPKRFQVGLVSADHRVYSQTSTAFAAPASSSPNPAPTKQNVGLLPSPRVLYGYNSQILVQTLGNSDTPHTITLTGPLTIPSTGGGWRVYNATTNTSVESITSATANLAAGETLVLDFAATTATHSSGANWYARIDFVQSEWSPLAAGTNDLRIFADGVNSSTGYRVSWRDAWL